MDGKGRALLPIPHSYRPMCTAHDCRACTWPPGHVHGGLCRAPRPRRQGISHMCMCLRLCLCSWFWLSLTSPGARPISPTRCPARSPAHTLHSACSNSSVAPCARFGLRLWIIRLEAGVAREGELLTAPWHRREHRRDHRPHVYVRVSVFLMKKEQLRTLAASPDEVGEVGRRRGACRLEKFSVGPTK